MKDNEMIKSNNEEKQIENHLIMPFQLFFKTMDDVLNKEVECDKCGFF